MEPREQFAANLKELRRRAKLSQEKLGETASLHRTEIGLLEGSKRDPRLATIVKLARALEVPAAELLAEIE
jgi:transcriptional regulator with XRE-family HTH domain